jgi:hypothetical protein
VKGLFAGVALQERAGFADDFVGGVTRQPFERFVDHQDGAFRTDEHQALIHGVNDAFPIAADILAFHLSSPSTNPNQ